MSCLASAVLVLFVVVVLVRCVEGVTFSVVEMVVVVDVVVVEVVVDMTGFSVLVTFELNLHGIGAGVALRSSSHGGLGLLVVVLKD